MNVAKRILIFIVALFIVLIVGFVVWAISPPDPMPEAAAALESDDQITVSTDEQWIVFSPTSKKVTTGLILYPGGRVNPRAYAPQAREIALAGYRVIIVPMPLNLAVFAPNRAIEVTKYYENIEHWAIGGHSLGGAMAANLIDSQPELIDGLVLWASFPAESNNLADSPIQAISIYATNDGLATVDDIEQSKTLLPETTEWVAITGGNHAQFGWYGAQSGDLPATMSRLDQQNLTVTATVSFLETLEN